ncbi:MAG: DUF4389 domain-containing protein [Nanoarchaeota archaeon]|nr:DUF4389 domain-containing protein [Nanoarchaeota archaeon]
MMSERIEALMRIPVGIVSGIVLGFWKILVQIVAVINWIMTLITDERNEGLADFCENWNTQLYTFLRYMTFVTNNRPFPFNPLEKKLDKFEK